MTAATSRRRSTRRLARSRASSSRTSRKMSKLGGEHEKALGLLVASNEGLAAEVWDLRNRKRIFW